MKRFSFSFVIFHSTPVLVHRYTARTHRYKHLPVSQPVWCLFMILILFFFCTFFFCLPGGLQILLSHSLFFFYSSAFFVSASELSLASVLQLKTTCNVRSRSRLWRLCDDFSEFQAASRREARPQKRAPARLSLSHTLSLLGACAAERALLQLSWLFHFLSAFSTRPSPTPYAFRSICDFFLVFFSPGGRIAKLFLLSLSSHAACLGFFLFLIPCRVLPRG